MTDFAAIEVGDRVWLGWSQWPRCRGLFRVSRTTMSQLTIDHHGDGRYLRRFHRLGGKYYSAGQEMGKGTMRDYISGIATAEECAAWDREQAKEAQKAKAAQIKAERIDAERDDLQAFIGEEYHVSHEGDGWMLTIGGLTAERVREIAIFLHGRTGGAD